MSHRTPTRTRASASSRPSSSTTRSGTTKTSPFFKAEAPTGFQSASIPIDDDDDDELPSFPNVAASSAKRRKRNDSAFIISDDEDDQRTTLRSIPLIKGTPLSQTKAVSKARKTTATKSATKPRTPKTPKASPKKPKAASPEKRRRPFRNHAPHTYQNRYERAITQRMFLIDREKKTNKDEYGTYPEEVFDMAGTTGNVYQVTIGKLPKCTCPDARANGMQCKHIIYVSLNKWPIVSILVLSVFLTTLPSSVQLVWSDHGLSMAYRLSYRRPSGVPLPALLCIKDIIST